MRRARRGGRRRARARRRSPVRSPGAPTRRSSRATAATSPATAPLFLVLLIAAFAAYLLALHVLRRTPPAHARRDRARCGDPARPARRAAPALHRRVDVLVVRLDRRPRATATRTPIRRRTSRTTRRSTTWAAPGSDTTTVYGPAFTAASEPLAVVAGDSDAVAAWSYKALAAAAALARPRCSPGGSPAAARSRSRSSAGTRSSPSISRAAATTTRWVGALILAAWRSRRPAALRPAVPSGSWRSRSSGFRLSSSRSARSSRARAGGRRASAGSSARRRGSRSAPRVLYGGAWPLAIFPLAGNAALETSYAIPHRLEQLGAAATTSRSGLRSRRSSSGSPVLARDAARGPRAARRSPPASCS